MALSCRSTRNDLKLRNTLPTGALGVALRSPDSTVSVYPRVRGLVVTDGRLWRFGWHRSARLGTDAHDTRPRVVQMSGRLRWLCAAQVDRRGIAPSRAPCSRGFCDARRIGAVALSRWLPQWACARKEPSRVCMHWRCRLGCSSRPARRCTLSCSTTLECPCLAWYRRRCLEAGAHR